LSPPPCPGGGGTEHRLARSVDTGGIALIAVDVVTEVIVAHLVAQQSLEFFFVALSGGVALGRGDQLVENVALLDLTGVIAVINGVQARVCVVDGRSHGVEHRLVSACCPGLVVESELDLVPVRLLGQAAAHACIIVLLVQVGAGTVVTIDKGRWRARAVEGKSGNVQCRRIGAGIGVGREILVRVGHREAVVVNPPVVLKDRIEYLPGLRVATDAEFGEHALVVQVCGLDVEQAGAAVGPG